MVSTLLICDAVDPENETAASESKASKETIDFKEFNRVNQILQSLSRKVIMKESKNWHTCSSLLILRLLIALVKDLAEYQYETWSIFSSHVSLGVTPTFHSVYAAATSPAATTISRRLCSRTHRRSRERPWNSANRRGTTTSSGSHHWSRPS